MITFVIRGLVVFVCFGPSSMLTPVIFPQVHTGHEVHDWKHSRYCAKPAV